MAQYQKAEDVVQNIYRSLDKSQWWSAEEIQNYQMPRIAKLIKHSFEHVPFYRDSLSELTDIPASELSMDILKKMPILKRSDLQDSQSELIAKALPKTHMPTFRSTTSGSTGKPISFMTTMVYACYLQALGLRWHNWNQRIAGGKLARISRLYKEDAIEVKGLSWGLIPLAGPQVMLSAGQTIENQLAWLQRENPAYLATYPSNLEALLDYSAKADIQLPGLKGVTTLSEVLDERVRNKCHSLWGIELMDSYGAEECGYLAMQCPEHRHYHVQSENVLIEVLNEHDQACAPGEVGRVVITTLNNYAMPFFRYQIDDYAEVGDPCPCGRSSLVIKRILGRSRNMFVLPTGEKFYPVISAALGACGQAVSGLRQIQLIQQSLSLVVIRAVTKETKFSDREEDKIKNIIGAALGGNYNLELEYLEVIPRSNSGKFEDAICAVA